MNISGWLAYAIAGIWAAALIATSFVLRGTPQSNLVIDILSACAIFTCLLLALSCRKCSTGSLKS